MAKQPTVKTDTELFRWAESRGGPFLVRHRRVFQLAQLDNKHPTAQRIGRLARTVAVGRFDRTAEAATATAEAKLDKILAELPTGALNILATLWMLYHPTVEAGATGKGGIWAAASDVANQRARAALKSRPMFEIIE